MAGAFIDSSTRGLGPALMMLNALGDPRRQAEGLVHIGGFIEKQTKERIAHLKTAPDGTPWAPWSAAYARTRKASQSLLVGEGNPGLLESIMWELDGDELRVGSDLPYAAIHQFGGEPGMAAGPAAIPARPYLGLSDENLTEIEDVLEAWIEGLLS